MKPSWLCTFFLWVAEETASKLVMGAALNRNKGGAGSQPLDLEGDSLTR